MARAAKTEPDNGRIWRRHAHDDRQCGRTACSRDQRTSTRSGSHIRLSVLTLCATLLLLPMACAAGAEDQPEIDCSGGGASTAEQQYCSEQALDKSDGELDAVYREALKKQAGLDRELAETDKNLVGAVASLKTAQRIWIQYRDAHCDTVGYAARGGTVLGSLLMDCKSEMTDGRIRQLRALIKGLEQE